MPERVSAVVPHYNSPETLQPLLRQLVELDFDAIYVLDDASDNCNMRAIAGEFPEVEFVYGAQNLGPAANRNRALGVVREGVVWFVDADMEIVPGADIPNALRAAFGEEPKWLVGGLILAKSGVQMVWNYGPEMHPVRDREFKDLSRFYKESSEEQREARWAELAARGWDYAWVDPENHSPVAREADWVAEGNFAVHIDEFRALGGYDERMRYHEGQDLARRLRERGVRVWFDPAISSRHLEVEVRGERRSGDFRDGQYYFYRKHFGMSREVFDWLYPQAKLEA